jgi:hypothetical protein
MHVEWLETTASGHEYGYFWPSVMVASLYLHSWMLSHLLSIDKLDYFLLDRRQALFGQILMHEYMICLYCLKIVMMQ